LSFNRAQSRIVIGMLTGHNTLRRHLFIYKTGLINNLICRKCGAQEETSVHILCECEVLDIQKWVPSFLDPEDIRKLSIRAIWNFAKGTGLLSPSTEPGAQMACLKA
jgi:hypothetical protein